MTNNAPETSLEKERRRQEIKALAILGAVFLALCTWALIWINFTKGGKASWEASQLAQKHQEAQK